MAIKRIAGKKNIAKPKVKVAHAAGKRKTAIARATVRAGKGEVRINSLLLDALEPEMLRLRIQEPLMIMGDLAKQVSIDVSVNGGGRTSQAEAARLAIAKSAAVYFSSEAVRKNFLDYDRQLLVADTRRKEPRKWGRHSKARAKRQLSRR